MKIFIEFAKRLAAASGELIREYFRADFDVEIKADNSPVTTADKLAEETMREMIARQFPQHGVISEEFKAIRPKADYLWYLDPIDGTNSFLAGTPLFGTLIALTHLGEPILGVIHLPVTGQLMLGIQDRTWLNDNPVSVRQCKSIENAVLLTTNHWRVHQCHDGPAFDALTRRARLYRTWGDCYGYYLVASGFADIMVDAAMHLWDLMALIPIVRGAGGVISDYHGGDPLSGEGLIATSGSIHTEVVRLLNPHRG
jgi:myo-inositol-1(or 4)-monophosphatase